MRRETYDSLSVLMLVVGLCGIIMGFFLFLLKLLHGNTRLGLYGLIYIVASLFVLALRFSFRRIREIRRRSRRSADGKMSRA